MNLCIQLGHLTREPEVRTTESGTKVLNCCIATNRQVPKDGGYVDEATFVEFTMWGKRAEAFARFHGKGQLAFLSGRMTNDNWDDRTTGKPRSKLKMTAEEWEFVNSKGQSTGRTSGEPYTAPEVDDTPF